MTDSILAQIEPLSRDQAIIDLLIVGVESNVTTLVHVIGYQVDSRQADAPAAAMAYARRLAQRGVPVGELLRAYRVGQGCFMQWCYRGTRGPGQRLAHGLRGRDAADRDHVRVHRPGF